MLWHPSRAGLGVAPQHADSRKSWGPIPGRVDAGRIAVAAHCARYRQTVRYKFEGPAVRLVRIDEVL